MTTFAVGEVAVIRGLQHAVHLNGAECEILEGLRRIGSHRCATTNAVMAPTEAYFARFADGSEGYIKPCFLRKRRPPSTDESESRQAMLDCIERARRGIEEPA